MQSRTYNENSEIDRVTDWGTLPSRTLRASGKISHVDYTNVKFLMFIRYEVVENRIPDYLQTDKLIAQSESMTEVWLNEEQ